MNPTTAWTYADKDELGFPPSPRVLRAIRTISLDSVRRYRKEPPLLARLARETGVPEGQIFLEAGVIGVIHQVWELAVGSSSTVLLPALGYPYYFEMSRHRGARIRTFPFRRVGRSFGYDRDALMDALDRSPDVLVLIDPESPLGFSTDYADLEMILARAVNVPLVILDRTQEGFRGTPRPSPKEQLKTYPNLLIAHSFSKIYGLAGLRIAYALCGDRVKERIGFKDRYLGFDAVAQAAAVAALDHPDYYARIAAKVRLEKKRFEEKIERLGPYSCLATQTASSVVGVPEEIRARLEKILDERRIAIRRLGTYHQELSSWVRITAGPRPILDHIFGAFRDALLQGASGGSGEAEHRAPEIPLPEPPAPAAWCGSAGPLRQPPAASDAARTAADPR